MKRWTFITLFMILSLTWAGFVAFGSDDEPKVKIDTDTIETWIRKLGAEDFEVREQAFDKLKALGEAARPQLKKALKSKDLEIRLRAMRLIGYLDGRKASNKKGRLELPFRKKEEIPFDRDSEHLGQDDLRRFFEEGGLILPGSRLRELFDLMERDFPTFRLTPFRSPFEELKGLEELGDFGELFEGLAEDHGLREGQDGSSRIETERIVNGRKESISLEMDAEGRVKATVVTTDEEGEEHRDTYEADSMEQFERRFPDVAKRFGLPRIGIGKGILLDRLRELWGESGPRPNNEGETLRLPRERSRLLLPERLGSRRATRGRTLGVYLATEGPGPVLREHLGLAEGLGVIVERVAEGSFASVLGLRSLDIILAIDGKRIGSADHIRAAMNALKDGARVKIEVLRKGERKTLEAKYEAPEGSRRKV